MIAQTFIPLLQLAIPTGIQTNEENEEIETQWVIVEDRISKCLT